MSKESEFKFNRGLKDEKGLNCKILNNAAKENTIWKEIVNYSLKRDEKIIEGDNQEIRIFIRERELHAYFNGCKICGVKLERGKLIYETHYKYLIDVDSDCSKEEKEKAALKQLRFNANDNKLYVRYNDNFEILNGSQKQQKFQGINSKNDFISEIIRRTKGYEGPEKKALHQIVCNYDVVDLEVAFGGLPPKAGSTRKRQERIDLALLNEGKLTFLEVKVFDYTAALRCSGASLPPVCDQLAKYDKLIADQKRYLVDSYRTILSNFQELEGSAFEKWSKNTKFEIDPKTKLLIIYPYTIKSLSNKEAVKDSPAWKHWEKEHETKIFKDGEFAALEDSIINGLGKLYEGHDIIYYFMADGASDSEFDFEKSKTIKSISSILEGK